MPIGCTSLVPMIVREWGHPSSVLDLGMGMGLWGTCVRQWLDYGVKPYRTKLVGVEGWEGYRNPIWDIYDRVVCSEIIAFLSGSTETFDCILLLDVIEHFTKEDGISALGLIRARLNPGGVAFIGTPAVFMEQGAVYGNELERHRCLWNVHEASASGEVLLDGSVDLYGNKMLLWRMRL